MAANRAEPFLKGYALDETNLLNGEPDQGRPGMFRARAPDGRAVLVKFWARKEDADSSDIRDIWRSEIRQLQRLAAVPRADELFVPMAASGFDANGFYIVLDPGLSDPLETFRVAAIKPTLLSAPKLARNRRTLWSNFLRLAQALELLHSQGIIHRNLDPWAVVSSFGEQPDFRLTGFEWSMRLATVDEALSVGTREPSRTAASFGQDWRNLGLLVAELIEAPVGRVADLTLLASEVADHLTVQEVRVLRALIGVSSSDRLDGEAICRDVEEVVSAIGAQAADREMKYAAAFRLDTGSKLVDVIRQASNYDIDALDSKALLDFIVGDLAGEPFLALVKDREGDGVRVALLGAQITYWLSQYRVPQSTDAPSWEFAVSEAGTMHRPPPAALAGFELLRPETLDLLPLNQAHQSFARRRGRVNNWQTRIDRLKSPESRKSGLDRKHQAFALLTILELAYAAADIFPVEVRPNSTEPTTGFFGLAVASRFEEERAALSKALRLPAPALRLSEILNAGDTGDEGWILSETGALGDRNTETQWRFVAQTQQKNEEVLKFEGTAATQIRGHAFLTAGAMRGRIAQFRRRVKALRALREHSELLRMFVDPRGRIEDSHDLVKNDTNFKSLDASKQAALRSVLSTSPFFLVQGPPGVGKTFLIADLVRRRFQDEPTTRLLLSAQSNAAIDHLMKEVIEGLPNDLEAVMVRARPADDSASDTDLEIDRQADHWLKLLSESDLVRDADDDIRSKIIDLAAARRARRDGGQAASREMVAEARAFEAMILRSANLVFATTNSGAVEGLLDERSLFDWSMVEEAGKATGGELLSPLLLSHRRLMIGDHQQLPPFGADRLVKLLSSGEAVKSALRAAQNLITRYLREPGIEEIFAELESDDTDYGRLCADTLEILVLFETLVGQEIAYQSAKPGRRSIFHKLLEQHRMHPAIAKIVSDCFYEGTIKTNEKKEKEYRTKSPPFRFVNPRILERPIVFIDLPYVREEIGYRGGDRAPPWSNDDEATAAIQVLRQLRAVDNARPSLAILSPYHEQVKRLRLRVNSELNASLSHLTHFAPAVGGEDYCGTVDSFQGDQADLVLVSLVRNNEHSTPQRALGFLSDDRRMNVLLSRAKWRMVIIGSLSFYRHAVKFSEALPDAELGFLKIFLESLDQAQAAKDAIVVPWADLKRPKS